METKENKLEMALANFREELKKAILNESVEMEVSAEIDDVYFAKTYIWFCGINIQFTVANNFVCYHDDFTKGIFDEKDDFAQFKTIVNSKLPQLSSSDLAEIKQLRDKIKWIKAGKK